MDTLQFWPTLCIPRRFVTGDMMIVSLEHKVCHDTISVYRLFLSFLTWNVGYVCVEIQRFCIDTECMFGSFCRIHHNVFVFVFLSWTIRYRYWLHVLSLLVFTLQSVLCHVFLLTADIKYTFSCIFFFSCMCWQPSVWSLICTYFRIQSLIFGSAPIQGF